MSEHTREPWHNNGTCMIHAGNAYLGNLDTFQSAGRAVDCVNACAGLNPEAIPALVEACEKAMPYLCRMTGDDIPRDVYVAMRTTLEDVKKND